MHMTGSSYRDFRDRPPLGIWHFLNRLLIVLIALAFLLLVGAFFVPELKATREQAAREEELRQAIQKQKDLLSRNMREKEHLIHDPAYVEIVARDRLDLMKEGETIYRIENARPVPAPAGSFHRNK